MKACNFFKKEIPTQVFSCGYCEIFKNTYFEHLRTASSFLPTSWNYNTNVRIKVPSPHTHISGLQTYKYFIPSPQFYLTRMLFTLLLSNFLQQQKNTFMLHRYLVSKLVNDTHREKLYCTQFSTFFHMFAQSFRFYTFHYDV